MDSPIDDTVRYTASISELPFPTISGLSKTSDSDWRPDVIVLGPGGLKGFLELGALHKFEQEGWLNKVNTFVGVSIGSVISILHLCGLSFVDISDIGIEMNLFDDWKIENFKDMLKSKGVVSPEHFRNTISRAIVTRMSKVPTFAELYKLTGKSFIAVSYNLTKRETVYFNRYSHPTMSIVEAAVASSSIPGVFYQYVYRNDIYIDGAFGNPYPVDIVDDGLSKVLGLYIDNTSQATSDSKLSETISAIFYAPIGELRKRNIQTSSECCKHLALVNNICDITGLQVDNKSRLHMFKEGYEMGAIFLSQFAPSESSSDDESDIDNLKSYLKVDDIGESKDKSEISIIYTMIHGEKRPIHAPIPIKNDSEIS